MIPRIVLDFHKSTEVFRNEFFEISPFCERKAFDSSACDWTIIDRALDSHDFRPSMLKILHKKERVPLSAYVEDFMDVGVARQRLIKPSIYGLLHQGATIVLNRLDVFSDFTRDICMQIAQYAGIQTAANAYASFGAEAATPAHWDTHDVFAVQLVGRKNWRLYKPTHELPISSQQSTGHDALIGATPSLEVVLEAGDILYVPRGWWHVVEPADSSDTVHLAVGVHAPLFVDYVLWACANLFPNDLSLRRSVVQRDAESGHMDQALESMFTLLRKPSSLEAFKLRIQAKERATAPIAINRLLRGAANESAPVKWIRLNARYLVSVGPKATINGVPLASITASYPLIEDILNILKIQNLVSIMELSRKFPEGKSVELREALHQLAVNDLIEIY